MTGARLALCAAWPDFAAATERSNRQALSPLEGLPDLLLVAALPAAAEELLFRGRSSRLSTPTGALLQLRG